MMGDTTGISSRHIYMSNVTFENTATTTTAVYRSEGNSGLQDLQEGDPAAIGQRLFLQLLAGLPLMKAVNICVSERIKVILTLAYKRLWNKSIKLNGCYCKQVSAFYLIYILTVAYLIHAIIYSMKNENAFAQAHSHSSGHLCPFTVLLYSCRLYSLSFIHIH